MPDATAPVAGKLLRDTVRALRCSDLRFTGTPKIVRRPPSRGLFVTDNKRLFVKVTEQDPTAEWIGARHGCANGVPGPRPAHRPIELDDGQWLLPFKWLQVDDASPSAAQVTETMCRIWATPPPPSAQEKPWSADAEQARLNIAAGAASPALKTTLLRLVDAAAQRVQAVEGSHPAVDAVWTHGDLHGGNLAMAGGRVQVLDWELHGISTRENEAAKHLQALLAEPMPHQLPGDPREFLDAMSHLDLDMDLLWRLTGLRAACAAAFQSRYPHPNPDGIALCIDLAHRAARTDHW